MSTVLVPPLHSAPPTPAFDPFERKQQAEIAERKAREIAKHDADSHAERRSALQFGKEMHARAVALHRERLSLEMGEHEAERAKKDDALDAAHNAEHAKRSKALNAKIRPAIDRILADCGDKPRATAAAFTDFWRALDEQCMHELGDHLSPLHIGFAMARVFGCFALAGTGSDRYPEWWAAANRSYDEVRHVCDYIAQAALDDHPLDVQKRLGDLEILVESTTHNARFAAGANHDRANRRSEATTRLEMTDAFEADNESPSAA